MAATEHLPADRPTKENEMPQGRKNWDKPPQQVDGGEPPLPAEKPAGPTNSKKKPQQVNGPEGPTPPGVPRGHATGSDDDVPQQVDGPDGPKPTDGTELVAAATSHKPEPKESTKPPAQAAASKSSGTTEGSK